MKRIFAALMSAGAFGLVFCSVSCRHAARSVEYQERIGVAVRLPGRICLSMRNRKLLPGTAITLLTPAGSLGGARSARALVDRLDGAACMVGGVPGYRLNLVSGEMELEQPMVALDARVPAVGMAHSFHECRLAGVVHLTAWDGARALEGRRVWHGFVQSTATGDDCTAAETF